LYYDSEDNDRNAKDNHFYDRKHSDYDHRNAYDHRGESERFVKDNFHLIKDYEDFK
jgi:hypothetical protein